MIQTKTDYNNSWISRDPEVVKEYYADQKCNFEFTLNGFLAVALSVKYCCDPTNVFKSKKRFTYFISIWRF